DVGADQRSIHASIDRYLWHADEVEDAERVLRGEVDAGVAIHAGRAYQLDVRREGRGHQGNGIVGAGIDVEDHLRWHARSVPDQPLARIAARTRSGVAGSVVIRTPTAAWIAPRIAGAVGMSAGSPTPL